VLKKEEEMPTYQSVVPNDKWPARYTFSPATRVGNLVFLSGTTGTDDEGNIVGPGDIVAQTRRIFEKFALILQSVGGNLSNIVDRGAPTRTFQGTALAGRHWRSRCRPHPRGGINRDKGHGSAVTQNAGAGTR
jgi:hypothetical protein